MSTSPTPCHCGAAGVFGYWRDGVHGSVMDWFCPEHRLGRWYADECRSEADANRAHAELRSPTDKPPDLQTLVAEHGGSYDEITPEAWIEFDRAMAAWRLRR